MVNVLVTGVSGFLGAALSETLCKRERYVVRGTVRSTDSHSGGIKLFRVPLGADTNWAEPLKDIEIIVHTAARVHVMHETIVDHLAEFRQINVAATLNLARQAALSGVKRFLFISSIKVNGEMTSIGNPYSPADIPAPQDSYGISKKEAEDGLRAVAAETGMEVVIVRPPLIYGPGVKANFATMMRWLNRGIPLPFGAVSNNRRSLVGLDNLIDFLITCIEHPLAANQTFLVSDGDDLSTAELLHRMALAMGKSAFLFPLPPYILYWTARALGKGDMAQRLLNNLQVDISKNRELLNWVPRFKVDEMLRKAAQGNHY